MYRILANTKDMARTEWLLLRKRGIGGSDAGAVCGLNPYVSALDVYYDKTNDAVTEDRDNESMRLGRDLEDYVAKRFCEETGFKVRRSNRMYQHEEYPFMLADVDRLIVGSEEGLVGLECKTASPFSAGKWKDGNIPAHYLAQCYHYMAVLGAKAWYIAVLIYGQEFKWIRLERDEEIIADLIRIEKTFWEEHVKKGILPEPDGSEAAGNFINRYFSESKEELSIALKDDVSEKLRRRQELEEQIGVLGKEKQKIEQEVKLYLGEAESAENERFFVSWKNIASSRIDAKKLKEEMPEVYEKFSREVTSRRFLVKAA